MNIKNKFLKTLYYILNNIDFINIISWINNNNDKNHCSFCIYDAYLFEKKLCSNYFKHKSYERS